jgi:hypothetical protein
MWSIQLAYSVCLTPSVADVDKSSDGNNQSSGIKFPFARVTRVVVFHQFQFMMVLTSLSFVLDFS